MNAADVTMLMTPLLRRVQGMGWRPDSLDNRDHHFDHLAVMRRLRQKLPAKADERASGLLLPLLDQGQLGSCAENAAGKLYEYIARLLGFADYAVSRLFVYYGVRVIEGTVTSDAGSEIRDVMKVLATLGAPHESLWPYNIGRFTEKPPIEAYADGATHKALAYERVAVTTTAVKAAVAARHPVVVGFTVYTSFFSIGADGFMPVPKPGERVEGGHAVLVVGYQRMKAPWDRTAKDYAIVQNSWGDAWGDHGYFYMPLAWLCNRANADDFWTLTEVERPAAAAAVAA